ncbi:MAG TPA: helix-turn-helix domain-containing protein [Thermoplasmata archaeon]|nr:helix-turn-helix domain-containing protein [Thermoplasmata archaeon]
MEGGRDRTIDRVRQILESAGFYVTDAHHVRPTSFDLLARRDALLVILKVLKNIDALDPSEAERLKALGQLFPASPLVVGQTSGATELEEGVVYSRYGVSIVVEESLRDYLLKGLPPFLFSSPGGIFARIDGGRLRELRMGRSLSLGALATVAGVSRRTIQLYEEGAGAEVDIVERLEAFLGEPIALALELFHAPSAPPARPAKGAARGESNPAEESDEPARRSGRSGDLQRTGDAMRDTVFRQLDGMGWEVVVTVRCPFDAFTHGATRDAEEILLTSVGSLRTAQHRAELLMQLARVAEGHALYVVREPPTRTSIEGLPLVSMEELRRHRDRAELLELLAEREGA